MSVETVSDAAPAEAAPGVRAPQADFHSTTPPAPRRLADYDRGRFDTGRRFACRAMWYFTSLFLFESGWFPFSRAKVSILRWFGSRIGRGVVIKPQVRVKFPWRLVVGDHCWIGQDVWIDNLAEVRLEDNVCLSQGAYVCTGSHDHRSREFDLITRPVHVAAGAWIGARAILLQGVAIGAEAVVAAGAVVTRDVEASSLVAGNPATVTRTPSTAPRQPR